MGAILAAGASAVRVGTRFVAATESEAHPRYIEKLIAAEAKDTVLTEAFSTNWPNAPHRVLRACVEAMGRFPSEVVGERVYPWAPVDRVPAHRGDSFVPMRSTTGEIDVMPLWAGESVGVVKGIQAAAEIVRELAEEAEALLGGQSSNPLRPRHQEREGGSVDTVGHEAHTEGEDRTGAG